MRRIDQFVRYTSGYDGLRWRRQWSPEAAMALGWRQAPGRRWAPSAATGSETAAMCSRGGDGIRGWRRALGVAMSSETVDACFDGGDGL
ncbi:hypothetical protein GUJ93_ZPchr0005g15127 [Zizania palustris]|uniref:Uncharacterized protein n=1 Tax=Zizania palustris TaxID=103762 RepID=A0A8J5SQI8_ZIZPA|nr:hypothetical protein GUJ93_ZPchr0005g15127 [Zizania palustris]